MAYISIGLYSFLNRVSMRIEGRGQAKGKGGIERGPYEHALYPLLLPQ